MTTHKFRAIIWAGVSSDPQAAKDKASIPDQIKTAREYILEEGGLEVMEPFVGDGYSRSGYEDLSKALNDIPPLKKAIDAATSSSVDVLVMDNFDRLGDLARMVFIRLRKYNKQLKSARQSGRVRDPNTYKASSDENTETEIHNAQGTNIYRIRKIRRGWEVGVPGRVDNGLHALRIPFGYEYTRKDQPAQLVPEIGAMLQAMKDMMLQGITYTEIGKFADTIHPSAFAPVWTVAAVHRTLTNPYYAGIIRFGVMSKRKPTNKSSWKFAQGKHEPLWDEATYYALISEAKRRMEGKRNYAARYPFSGLTWCGVCGSKINKHGVRHYNYLACNSKPSHWSMRYEDAPAYLAEKVARGYEQYQEQPRVPFDFAPLLKRLSDTQSLRAQIQSDREVGIYTQDEAVAKINKLTEDEEETKRIIEQAKEREQTRADWHAHSGEIRNLQQTINTDDPGKLNRLLTAWIDKIILAGEDTTIVWRE